MNLLIDYHHYNVEHIDSTTDRVAIYERYIIDMLLKSEIKDNQRESTIAFELKHHHSTAQFARVLARQRNLPIDVCTVGALLHDVYVIKHGVYKNHAFEGAKVAENILNGLGGFSPEEISQILLIVSNHSDKDVWSDNAFEEFGKDVDILDAFLYPNAFGYYLKHKKLSVFHNYVLRAKKIWNELNVPIPKDFSILENYSDRWLNHELVLTEKETESFLQTACFSGFCDVPTFLLSRDGDKIKVNINSISYSHCEIISQNVKNSDLEKIREVISKLANSPILVWSAINAYELINENSPRLGELGV